MATRDVLRRAALPAAVVGVLLLVAALLIVLLPARGPAPLGETFSVRPERLADDDKVANPGKGWVAYGDPAAYEDTPDPAYGDEVAHDHGPRVVALSDVAYTRWNWSEFYTDPADPATFTLAPLDRFVTSWLETDPDRRFAFAVMGENTDDCTAEVSVTPAWVFDIAGAAHVWSGSCRTPVWNDPVYLAAYRDLMVRVRDHLAATDEGTGEQTWLDRVEFVGANSYGSWGEGHTYGLGEGSCGAGARTDENGACVLSDADYRTHLRIFLDVFTPSGTPVSVPWGATLLDDDGAYDWAVAQGLGMRRDGIFGDPGYTPGSRGENLVRTHGISPATFELHAEPEDVTDDDVLEALEIGRPTYFGLGWPDEADRLYGTHEAVVDEVQRLLGADLVLEEASGPTRITGGVAFRPRLRWSNDGLAPAYEPLRTGFALLDVDDVVVATSFPGSGTSPQAWAPGRSVTEQPSVRFDLPALPRLAEGDRLRLAVGVFHASRPGPGYRLAVDLPRTDDGWYPLTEVRAVAGTDAGAERERHEVELLVPTTTGPDARTARTRVAVRRELLSGGMGDRFNAETAGDAITYRVPVTTPGRYAVRVRTWHDSFGGTYQLLVDGEELGAPQSTWAADDLDDPATGEVTDAGAVWLAAGEHEVTLRLVGTESPRGASLTTDYVELQRQGTGPVAD
ncbi:hypothetical protein [Nocardioides sp. SYSU D00038]|uniref:hypothetical protein n=1 Tax=Nocardioides sp. SYSU D00038 TaxID=2812554 RepID=UPI0019681A56|nr:hypothetical protein [Nocardioides sp. SYSU D00038]